jgi:nucleoside-diphosphate-sugar epimerase
MKTIYNKGATPMNYQKNPDINTVLFIGPNGNIGRALIPELVKIGYKVRALQFRSPVEPREGVEIVEGNTLDREAMLKAAEDVDAICHMIRPLNGPGDTPCDKWFNGCVAGTKNLLEAAKEYGVKLFINGSADNVFGHTTVAHDGPIDETHPKRFADNYYGLFKIVEEEMLRQYYLGFGVPVVITRFPWIWTDAFSATGAFTLDKENRKIKMKLDRDGKPHTRHDVFISDAVQGILRCFTNEKAIGDDFLFVGPAAYSSRHLADILQKKYDWPVEEIPTDNYSWTSSSQKARDILGYHPKVDLMNWLEGMLADM